MALATRCPNCHALFRVVADQLKLRGGLVRCGACQHVFDAIGTLSYIDDAVLPAAGPVTAAPMTAVPISEAQDAKPTQPGVLRGLPDLPSAPAETEASAFRATRPAAADTGDDAQAEPVVDDREIAAFTGQDVRADAETRSEHPGEVPVAMAPDEEPAALEFLRESTPRRRGLSIFFAAGTLALLFLAAAQAAVVFRADILARLPQSRPALTQLCKAFQCTVNWPARGDMLAVVGSELQALPGTSAFELTAVVRNRGALTLALPAIELTLTDTLNRTVARKIFAPVDYLAGESDPQAKILAGIAPGADLTVKIAFEARGLNAAGFVVYPFYL